jgi:hypothetical protein
VLASAFLPAGFHKTDVDFAVHEGPFPGRPQLPQHVVESACTFGCKVKEAKEVERRLYVEVSAVKQAARDGRKIAHADGDMVRVGLENRTTLILRERPPFSLFSQKYQRSRVV